MPMPLPISILTQLHIFISIYVGICMLWLPISSPLMLSLNGCCWLNVNRSRCIDKYVLQRDFVLSLPYVCVCVFFSFMNNKCIRSTAKERIKCINQPTNPMLQSHITVQSKSEINEFAKGYGAFATHSNYINTLFMVNNGHIWGELWIPSHTMPTSLIEYVKAFVFFF